MKKYTTVFFDLDGTLVDSGEGVTNSCMYALEKFGIQEKKENLYRFIGPPLYQSFKEFYGFDGERAEIAVKTYREYYKEKGIYECHLYNGIEDLLKYLKEKGYKIALATSKPEDYAHRVLDFLGISKYFDYKIGATMDEKTRATKEAVIEYTLSVSNTSAKDAIMVGDRHFDINGANTFGMDSIGVIFGYGSYEELKGAGATHIVKCAKEIKDIL